MRFTLEVEMGNDLMRTKNQLADALERTAEMLRQIEGRLGSGRIADLNGNTVGKWEEVADDAGVRIGKVVEAPGKRRTFAVVDEGGLGWLWLIDGLGSPLKLGDRIKFKANKDDQFISKVVEVLR